MADPRIAELRRAADRRHGGLRHERGVDSCPLCTLATVLQFGGPEAYRLQLSAAERRIACGLVAAVLAKGGL